MGGRRSPHAAAALRAALCIVAVAVVRTQTADFVAAARAAGDDVTFSQAEGNHNWPRTRQRFPGARAWGFFAPVDEAPTTWKYSTVEQYSEAYGYRFNLAAAPDALVTYERDGAVLRGRGRGSVLVTPPRGSARFVSLPFTLAL